MPPEDGPDFTIPGREDKRARQAAAAESERFGTEDIRVTDDGVRVRDQALKREAAKGSPFPAEAFSIEDGELRAPDPTEAVDVRVFGEFEEGTPSGDVELVGPDGERRDLGADVGAGSNFFAEVDAPDRQGEFEIQVGGETVKRFEVGPAGAAVDRPEQDFTRGFNATRIDADRDSAGVTQEAVDPDEQQAAASTDADVVAGAGAAEALQAGVGPERLSDTNPIDEQEGAAIAGAAEEAEQQAGGGQQAAPIGEDMSDTALAQRGSEANRQLRERIASDREGLTAEQVDLVATDDGLAYQTDGAQIGTEELDFGDATPGDAAPRAPSTRGVFDGDVEGTVETEAAGAGAGEARATVNRFGQQQLAAQDVSPGAFEGERLVTDDGVTVPRGRPIDLGDTEVPFPETERVEDGALTASDAAGTGTRDAFEATGDTERVETILDRRSRAFTEAVGNLAADAAPTRDVSARTQRRLRSADTGAITGGTPATAASTAQGVGLLANPFAAASETKDLFETAGFVAGAAGTQQGTGGPLDRANIAAGQVGAGLRQLREFAEDNPRTATAAGVTAAGATVLAPVAGGRALTVRDLTAEVDPRIGPFGETFESRALSRFRSDDRAQADPAGLLAGSDDGAGGGLPDEIEAELNRFETATRLRQARERARDRVQQRQDELGPQDVEVEPSTPGRTRSASRSTPVRQPSGGPDTSRSGPTAAQESAFRSSLIGDDPVESPIGSDDVTGRSVDKDAATPDGDRRTLSSSLAAALVAPALERQASAQASSVDGRTAAFGESITASAADSDAAVFEDADLAPETATDTRGETDAFEDVFSDVERDTDAGTDLLSDPRSDVDVFEDTDRALPRDLSRDLEQDRQRDREPTRERDRNRDRDRDPFEFDRVDVDPDPRPDPEVDDDDEEFLGGFGTRRNRFENPVETPSEFLGRTI